MASGSNEIETYFGRCRCCLNYGYLKNMWEEHYWEGKKEIYVDMLVQCFALSWDSEGAVSQDQICESCIKRLRDAYLFKKVVLESQEELLGQPDEVTVPIEIEDPKTNFSVPIHVKQEEEYALDYKEMCEADTDSPGDRMFIDDPDDPNYVDPDDPGEPSDMQYEEVEYLEDDDNKAAFDAQTTATTERRTKASSNTESASKWPKKLPKNERYKTYKQYSEEDLRNCLEAVRNEEMTALEASEKYNVPKKTICAKIKLDSKDDRWQNSLKTTEKQGKPRKISKVIVNREVIFKFKDNVRHILENSNATPIKGHWGIGYGCSYCPYQNASPAELKKHSLEKHLDVIEALKVKNHMDLVIKLDITGLQCKLCCENFAFLDKFMEHLILFHDKEMYFDIDDHIIPFKFDSEYLHCALCSQQFDYFKHLAEHMNEHYRNYECDICGRGFINKRSLKTHLFRHKTGVFMCSYCSKVFDTRIKMKEHERVLHVRASKTRKCGYCDEKFMDPVRKTYHEVSVHGAPAPCFECKACGKKFDSQRALKAHTNQYHLMLKPHTCSECGKGFYYKNELKRHEVKHTGLREFQCEVCLKWYSSRKTMRVHMRIHQNDRRFSCETCGQTFVHKCNWLQHLRSKHGEND